MGRPVLENREGRGVRQLEIHRNERRLGITERREPGRGRDWPSLLACRLGKARIGPFRPTDANAGQGTTYYGQKKRIPAGTRICRPEPINAGPGKPNAGPGKNMPARK
jgi:hypothetical protein